MKLVEIILNYPGGFKAVCHDETATAYDPGACWRSDPGDYPTIRRLTLAHAATHLDASFRLVPWMESAC